MYLLAYESLFYAKELRFITLILYNPHLTTVHLSRPIAKIKMKIRA
jgi:hypothetical protein